MMTRKDFERIAQFIAIAQEQHPQEKPHGPQFKAGFQAAVIAVAAACKASNPRFDAERFRKAAGL